MTQSIPVVHLYDRCLQEDSTTGATTDVLIGKLMADNGLTLFALNETETRVAAIQ